MASFKRVALPSVEDQIGYAAYGEMEEDSSAADFLMQDTVDRVFWDPKTGKSFLILIDGDIREIPTDEDGIPVIPSWKQYDFKEEEK